MMPSSRSNPPERLDPPEDVLFVINIYDYLSSELRTSLLAGSMFKLTAYAADSPTQYGLIRLLKPARRVSSADVRRSHAAPAILMASRWSSSTFGSWATGTRPKPQ